MIALLAAPLMVAAAGILPESRIFYRPDHGPTLQPLQARVTARLVHVSQRVAVYQEESYAFDPAGPDSEQERIASLVRSFEDTILPRSEAAVGSCPDLDANGKVLILVTRLEGRPSLFWRYDLMPSTEAASYGFQSNEGEVLYTSLEFSGNRSRLNLHHLAVSLVELLNAQHALHAPSGWGHLAACYAPFALDLAPARLLWGDYPPNDEEIKTTDALGFRGWALLFFHYLTERLGEGALRLGPEGTPLHLGNTGETPPDLGELLADYAMACWLDDPAVGQGQYAFRKVDPPRPAPSILAVASRPTSGVVQVGLGGMAFLVIAGSDERSFPVTLQGDRGARWSARAVVCRRSGPYEELPAELTPAGTARVELPNLGPEDHAVIAVTAQLTGPPGSDSRTLPLLWGVGWVPHTPPDPTRAQLKELLGQALPDGGAAIRARLNASIVRLAGLADTPQAAPGLANASDAVGQPLRITSRYAWSPHARLVPQLIVEEAGRRGLTARMATLQQTTGNGITQDWSNVLIHLPGTDERRWPIVVAAHWDATRTTLDDSFHEALGINDNAAGVAVALEAAAALSRTKHRAPILVAFLAGGCQGSEGARALLGELRNKVTSWVELEAVGVPDRAPRGLWIHLQGEHKLSKMPLSFTQALKEVGLVGRPGSEISSRHCGASIAFERGIPALVVRARGEEPGSLESDTPVEVEREQVSEDLMALLAKAVSSAVADLAGSP